MRRKALGCVTYVDAELDLLAGGDGILSGSQWGGRDTL